MSSDYPDAQTDGMSSDDHGAATASQVEDICRASYLADFVVKSPRYDKLGAGEKEAADLLLPFGDRAICFQVKSRRVEACTGAWSAREIRRLERRIGDAIRQVRALQEAVATGALSDVENLRGIRFPIDWAQVTSFVGIVVLNVSTPASWTAEDELQVCNGLDSVAGIPVHVFLLEDFRLIAKELDTLPDLFSYLDARGELMKRRALFPLTCERDLLAVYLTQYGTIRDCLSGKIDALAVVDGAWERSRAQGATAFKDRELRRQESLIVDALIQQLHRCIGFDAEPDAAQAKGTSRVGTPESYFEMACELAGLRRSARMELAPRIFEKARRADNDPKGFSYFVAYSTGGSMLLFVACRLDRKHRRDYLWKIGAAAFVKFRPTRLIGIGTGSYSMKEVSQDYLLIEEGASFSDEADLKRAADQMFSEPDPVGRDEWGNSYPPSQPGQ